MNHKRLFEINRDWELREDDERRPHVDSPLISDPKSSVRISPEGCDSVAESVSRQGSKKSSADHMKLTQHGVIKINIEEAPAEPCQPEPCQPEHTTDANDNSIPLDTCSINPQTDSADQHKLSSASVLQMECSV